MRSGAKGQPRATGGRGLAFVLTAALGVLLASTVLANASTELCAAVDAGDVGAARRLLESGVDPHTAACGDRPALMRALFGREQSVQLVAVLLEHGADPNLANASGVSPFLLWAGPPDPLAAEKLELLVAHGAMIDAAGNGLTPLINAARFCNTPLIAALLEHGADPNAQPRGKVNPTGESALHQLARGPQPPVKATAEEAFASARLLLEAGARVRRADSVGITPLMNAAAAGWAEMVELLLEAGADPTREAIDGSTARLIAKRSGHHEVAKILRRAERRAAAGG